MKNCAECVRNWKRRIHGCLRKASSPVATPNQIRYWVTDPTGIAWETFHTLGTIPVYGEDTAVFDHWRVDRTR